MFAGIPSQLLKPPGLFQRPDKIAARFALTIYPCLFGFLSSVFPITWFAVKMHNRHNEYSVFLF